MKRNEAKKKNVEEHRELKREQQRDPMQDSTGQKEWTNLL